MNASLSREQNKLTGSFYTPQGIAEDIAGNSISKWLSRCTGVDFSKQKPEQIPDHKRKLLLNALSEIKILDPSVGDGVFLLAAGEWLLNTRIALGDTSNIVNIREQIAMKSLYGVDIQELPIQQSAESLLRWLYNGSSSNYDEPLFNLKVGNSLIGNIICSDNKSYIEEIPKALNPFHWHKGFPEVFADKNGFDVIIGNPPYGNLLSQSEKEIIRKTFDYDIMKGREGTWNAASLFIVRVFQLLNRNGELGFLVPNSILRVGQFLKTRRFLLNPFNLWSIIDEGNPFDDVTLEMVSIFCSVGTESSDVIVRSRREEVAGSHIVSRDVFSSNQIYTIYHDDLLSHIQNIGTSGVLKATRGRDIPVSNLSRNHHGDFTVPYATKGRSVNRYRVVEEHLRYSNDWFLNDSALSESYNNEFLVATKNFPYPRCIVKPKGMIHGGGIVRIIPQYREYDIRALGLILNSQLSRYICTRYLTNYSQLTTCLNTGIISEFPIVYPEEQGVFSNLFDLLHYAHSTSMSEEEISLLESTADAIVYASYFPSLGNSDRILDALRDIGRKTFKEINDHLTHDDVQTELHSILNQSIVRNISASPRMN